ncbi:efflux RND transporter periplasmic adaptor subunit [Terricaulis sp.]|uniref:efflux RND transporter periplasmic adaptor subunit n=1 Tax=Terricaulis sp. TaxID=2768686 RepID=UPI002AC3CB45|nr:efflux RND transporter periplasmic adaptor subunit [Terricaulis sp.]MDZ4689672.1 efflux RND transporter periplasmic adaptor subunit [Terricaulis sp.]
MRRVHGWLAALLLLGACGQPEQAPEAPAQQHAGELTIQRAAAPDFKTVSAVLTSRDVGDARARIGGTLTRLMVREGEQVRRGQVVAIISDQRLALEAQAGSAGIAAAEASAERARADQARFQILFERGFLSQARMDQVNAETRAAEAQLRAARSQGGALSEANAQGRVLSPADGRVTRAPIPQGAVVMPGEVVVAIATGARVLRLELPEAQAEFLSEGQEIRILDAQGDGAARLVRVRQVYPAIENGRVMADLDAQGFDGEFVGARVRVLIPAGERQAIVIPGRYIETRYGVDYVRLVRAGGAVIDAPVQRGGALPTEASPDGVEILSGLAPGDVIVLPEPRT